MPAQQRSRLKALHDAGAHIYFCCGSGRPGAYHRKALICDRRYLISGEPNFTSKSRSSKEPGYRLTGQGVSDVLNLLGEGRAAGTLWDGRWTKLPASIYQYINLINIFSISIILISCFHIRCISFLKNVDYINYMT